MKILVMTTLFPNAAMPAHGVFVENRLRAYLKKFPADVKVIAPVPFFPFRGARFGKYGAFARAPLRELRGAVEVHHPRYLLPPKIGMHYAPLALERCFYQAARRLQKSGWAFDVIDAHYFYPDGVAAARVARRLGKPIIITARGTDINLIPAYSRPRKMIVQAAQSAQAVVTVAQALKDELVRLGAPEQKITTLRNGVDLSLFRPRDRDAVRRKLNLDGPVIASVGHLIERKGHGLVIDALARLPGATLLIAGAGEQLSALRAHAASTGVADRVRFLGAVPHAALADIYSAADVLALASSREGWPNVLLEAMACGTPAVATDVWGSREVITAPEAGRLVPAGDAGALAAAMQAIFDNPRARSDTRRYAEQYSWDETAAGMNTIFHAITAKKNTP